MLMQCKRTGVVGLMVSWGNGNCCFCHNTVRNYYSWGAASHGHKESAGVCLKSGYKYGWNYSEGEVEKLFTPVVLENV